MVIRNKEIWKSYYTDERRTFKLKNKNIVEHIGDIFKY